MQVNTICFNCLWSMEITLVINIQNPLYWLWPVKVQLYRHLIVGLNIQSPRTKEREWTTAAMSVKRSTLQASENISWKWRTLKKYWPLKLSQFVAKQMWKCCKMLLWTQLPIKQKQHWWRKSDSLWTGLNGYRKIKEQLPDAWVRNWILW